MTSTKHKSPLKAALRKNKLTGSNFPIWSRALRNFLRSEGTEYVLEREVPEAPAYEAPKEEKDAHRKHAGDALYVQYLMLANMDSNFQNHFDDVDAYSMYQRLKRAFQMEVRSERYKTVCALMDCKLEDGQEVIEHINEMMGLLDKMTTLGHPVEQGMAIDMVLRSLPKRFDHFVINFNLHSCDVSLSDLREMIAKMNLDFKENGSLSDTNPRTPKLAKRGAASSDRCHYCNGKGHWMRNCPKYLSDKRNGVGTSGIDSVIGKITHLHIV